MMVSSSLLLLPLLLLIGAVAGFLSGLLGVGGGIVIVPSLFFTLSLAGIGGEHAMHVTVGTSLCVIVATVLTSSRAHHKRGAVDAGLLKSWGPFLALGVGSGALVAGGIDGKFLKVAFALVTLFMSGYMAFGGEVTARPKFLGAGVQRLLVTLIGGVAAMTGMGGAVLTIPLMTAVGVPMHRAVGTGAALGVLVAATGAAGYIVAGLGHAAELPPFSLGYVNLLAAACIMPGAMLMAPYGVKVSHRTDKKPLRRVFALVMALVSIRMFMSI